MRNFIFSLIAIGLLAAAFFVLLVFFELPLLWLAKFGFPTADLVEVINNIAGSRTTPSYLGVAFLTLVIATTAMLFALLYAFLAQTVTTFSFLSHYYKKLYKTFIAGILVVAWSIPTLWLFIPFNLALVSGISVIVVGVAFAAITILLKDVLILVESRDSLVNLTGMDIENGGR